MVIDTLVPRAIMYTRLRLVYTSSRVAPAHARNFPRSIIALPIPAFTAVRQFVIGNSSAEPCPRRPGLQEADFMIGKAFRITERYNLEFRAEAFNVSNTPPLNDPNGSFGSVAFGSITAVGNPPDFEFVAKVRF